MPLTGDIPMDAKKLLGNAPWITEGKIGIENANG